MLIKGIPAHLPAVVVPNVRHDVNEAAVESISGGMPN